MAGGYSDGSSGHGTGNKAEQGHGDDYFHVVPTKFLVSVLCVLLFLTFVTVAVSYLNLGPFNLVVALVIAFIKASLVVMFFMHLRWDKPFNSVVFVATLFFLMLFIGFCILDAKEYEPNRIRNFRDPKFNLPQYSEELETPPGVK